MNINEGVNTHVLQEDPPPNPDTISFDDHTPMENNLSTEFHITEQHNNKKINQSNIKMTKKEYTKKNYHKKIHKPSSNNFKD